MVLHLVCLPPQAVVVEAVVVSHPSPLAAEVAVCCQRGLRLPLVAGAGAALDLRRVAGPVLDPYSQMLVRACVLSGVIFAAGHEVMDIIESKAGR